MNKGCIINVTHYILHQSTNTTLRYSTQIILIHIRIDSLDLFLYFHLFFMKLFCSSDLNYIYIYIFIQFLKVCEMREPLHTGILNGVRFKNWKTVLSFTFLSFHTQKLAYVSLIYFRSDHYFVQDKIGNLATGKTIHLFIKMRFLIDFCNSWVLRKPVVAMY